MSSSLEEPTRLLPPWDFPGKNTGVGRHAVRQPLYQINNTKTQHTHTHLPYVLLDSNTKLNRKIVTLPLQFAVASPRGASLGWLMSCDKQG